MKNQENIVVKNKCHSRKFLSGIFNACRCQIKENALSNRYVEYPRQRHSGMTPDLMGFTLIELLVVILIIGILAAVAVPQYQKAVEKSRITRMLPILSTVARAQDAYFLANGEYSIDLDELDIAIKHGNPVAEISNEGRTVYEGVEGGRLNLYKETHMVVWKSKYVTIDWAANENDEKFCYTENTETDLGEQICAAFGSKVQNMRLSDGTLVGYYKMNL